MSTALLLNLKLEKCVGDAVRPSVSQAHAINLPLDIQKQFYSMERECGQISEIRTLYKKSKHKCVHSLV